MAQVAGRLGGRKDRPTAQPPATVSSPPNAPRFAVGAVVLVQRSSGEKTEAVVISYDPAKAMYNVEFDGHKRKHYSEGSMTLVSEPQGNLNA